MNANISRRSFLVAAGAGVAATAVPSLLSSPLAAAQQSPELSPLVLSSDLYVSTEPQRFVFAVAVGQRFASFEKARVAFAPPGTNEGTILPTRLYREGLPRGRGIYRVDPVFDQPGTWNALLLTKGKKTGFEIEVKVTADAPTIGSAAPRAASPTKQQPLDVKPICTRRPQCGLHTVSIDQVVGNGRPAALIFATPALCQSQYCGPVVDQLRDEAASYGDQVQLAHVEIYRSNTGAALAPTVEAWGLPSEPWLFGVDGSGTIRARLDGAFGQEELRALLDGLAAG